MRSRNDTRVRGVNAVNVGIDIATVGADRRRHGHRRGVGAAAPERGEATGLMVQALKTGDDRHFLALGETADQFGAVDIKDAG